MLFCNFDVFLSKNIKKFFTKTIAKFAKKMHNINVIGDIASAIKFPFINVEFKRLLNQCIQKVYIDLNKII